MSGFGTKGCTLIKAALYRSGGCRIVVSQAQQEGFQIFGLVHNAKVAIVYAIDLALMAAV